MNGSQPIYPSLSSPSKEEINPFHQTSMPTSSSPLPSTQGMDSHPSVPSSSSPPPPPNYDDNTKTWGTHVMGTPAVPTCHPDNKKAALWGAGDEAQHFHHPYLQYNPIEKPSNSPMESILQVFNSLGNKAETLANNIWHNLRTGSTVHGAAWGKMNLTAKALSEGGFESLYKQTFATYANEKLKKTFACYLSTSTGPVTGTLYLSNAHVAFCSDCPLSFTAPSGQETWSYYKVLLPLGKIGMMNPVVMRDNLSEKYIQIVTIDGHDFWFMGFVNYEKASRHLTESISNFVAPGIAVPPPPGVTA
ncbi:GRAM domain-containing protein [Cephalotus follicularis]|uniref:GRAM domain-containing protein n=1 Tax=Cephalotus follicularis TaxID=3775 RepID=A0A1Q3CAH0_CEPFO|nr:GRAM domain-containing protein [Cephalotus follicularis]